MPKTTIWLHMTPNWIYRNSDHLMYLSHELQYSGTLQLILFYNILFFLCDLLLNRFWLFLSVFLLSDTGRTLHLILVPRGHSLWSLSLEGRSSFLSLLLRVGPRPYHRPGGVGSRPYLRIWRGQSLLTLLTKSRNNSYNKPSGYLFGVRLTFSAI